MKSKPTISVNNECIGAVSLVEVSDILYKIFHVQIHSRHPYRLLVMQACHADAHCESCNIEHHSSEQWSHEVHNTIQSGGWEDNNSPRNLSELNVNNIHIPMGIYLYGLWTELHTVTMSGTCMLNADCMDNFFHKLFPKTLEADHWSSYLKQANKPTLLFIHY